MTMTGRRLRIAAVAVGLLAPVATLAATPALPKARLPKITVHPKHRWHGYGFLPGYRQPPDLTDWRDRSADRSDANETYELRYWHNGQLLYGFGRPGFYRGRWNGGGFGPCWTQTPIGPMWNCGQ